MTLSIFTWLTTSRHALNIVNAFLDRDLKELQFEYRFLKYHNTPFESRSEPIEIHEDEEDDDSLPGTPLTEEYLADSMAVANINTLRIFKHDDKLKLKR